MRKAAALAVFLTINAPFAALAQSHTAEDEAACTPDVMALCQQYIPQRQDIIACLNAKKQELSPACFAVFSRPCDREKGRGPAPPAAQADHPKSGRQYQLAPVGGRDAPSRCARSAQTA